ncbi:PREDICTED: uncharacterized protein LOC108662024, partial [Theobroma cacao]|uniref:Uncharacterized protein LOC108662024 n=1 Tax=Theobroma cacao TaxID=3641 RepID=A0AB32WFA9_THECC
DDDGMVCMKQKKQKTSINKKQKQRIDSEIRRNKRKSFDLLVKLTIQKFIKPTDLNHRHNRLSITLE